MDQKLDAVRVCRILQRLQPRCRGCEVVGKCRHTSKSGRRLHYEVLPLAVEFAGQDADAGRIAAGFGKRAHESLPQHIVCEREDRNHARRPLRGPNRGIPAGQDDIDLGFDQLRRMFFESLGAQSVTVSIDREVLAFDEAGAPEFLKQRDMMRRIARTGVHGAEAIGSPRRGRRIESAAAAPPTSVMNPRRFMAPPSADSYPYHIVECESCFTSQQIWPLMSQMGQTRR